MLCRLPPGASRFHAATSCGPPTFVQYQVDRLVDSFQPDHHSIGPDLGEVPASGGRAHRRDHLRTAVRRQLHREPTDASRSSGDEHPLAPNRTAGPQCLQRRDASHRQGRGLGQVDSWWYLGERADVHGNALREGPGRQRHHPGAHGRPAAVGRRLYHQAGRVGTEHSARRHPAGLCVVQIPVIQRGMVHLDEHLVSSGRRFGDLAHAHRHRRRGISYERSNRHVSLPAVADSQHLISVIPPRRTTAASNSLQAGQNDADDRHLRAPR